MRHLQCSNQEWVFDPGRDQHDHWVERHEYDHVLLPSRGRDRIPVPNFEPLIEPSSNDPGVIFLGECRRLVDQFLARPKICVFHDIEENVDTEVSAAECADNLDRMLRIEKELRVDATYNMLGILLARKRQIIEASNPRHSIAFHSFNHSLNDMTQLRQCRDVDLRVRGYRPPRSRITAELSDYNLTFWNFEWLASSVFSLGSEACRIENGLVKIPIAIDDYPLFTRAVDYQDWERDLLERARAKKFFGFGLHDCYAGLWLERYPQLLHKLAQIGDS